MKYGCLGLLLLVVATACAAERTITPKDTPSGFASLGVKNAFAGSNKKAVTVTTREALLAAVSEGGLIYIQGMIDMSDAGNGSLLPTESGGTTVALDAFVSRNAPYANYAAFKDAYVAACTSATEDGKSSAPQSSVGTTLWKLNHTYRDIITVKVKSDTTIIGIDKNSGIKGGSFSITKVSNVALRNLTIQDAYDPFPHHEKNDGFNAQHDAIHIEGSTSVWIDHCTIQNTMGVSYVKTGGTVTEKWQTYDGFCDITGASKNVTVSFCAFTNGDKVMLIGSSDTESVSGRTVTLHHNYFYNCGQRLPMVRLTDVHLYNNYFQADATGFHKQNYAIGVRYNANIYAEANYIDTGINYSVSGTSAKQGNLYAVRNVDNSAKKQKSGQFVVATTAPFVPPYHYNAVSAEKAKADVLANAGAGCTVKK